MINYQDSHVKVPASPYSQREELANSISHGIGVLIGVVGLIMMLNKAYLVGLSSVDVLGIILYGLSFITLFLCSTLYHSVSKPALKAKLKLADHLAIYLLIAGTYTPLMLITLNNFSAQIVLITIWCLAIFGIVFKVIFIKKFEKLSLVIYLFMGWLCLVVANQLINKLSELGFNLLIAGGLFYSVGVIFYASKKIKYNHAIWHLFVLGGAISHLLCIYLTVI